MGERVESTVRAVLLLIVGGIGAAVGFHHTRGWAEENGQTGLVAWGIAVVVESMAVIAGFELRRKPGLFPAAVLVGAFVLQMAAQVAGARDTVAGWLLAACPALGFLLIVKLAMREARDVAAGSPAPVSAVVSTSPVEVAAERADVAVPEIEQARPEIEVPVTPAMAWLPVAARDQVREIARTALVEGRAVHADDLRSVSGLTARDLMVLPAEINASAGRQ